MRKSKEKEKRKDTTADNDSGAFLSDNGLTAEELVMRATGCKVQNKLPYTLQCTLFKYLDVII